MSAALSFLLALIAIVSMVANLALGYATYRLICMNKASFAQSEIDKSERTTAELALTEEKWLRTTHDGEYIVTLAALSRDLHAAYLQRDVKSHTALIQHTLNAELLAAINACHTTVSPETLEAILVMYADRNAIAMTLQGPGAASNRYLKMPLPHRTAFDRAVHLSHPI